MTLHGDDLDEIGYELKGQPDGSPLFIVAVVIVGMFFLLNHFHRSEPVQVTSAPCQAQVTDHGH